MARSLDDAGVTGGRRLPPWLGALRPHHWVKNLLVFVPLAAAHQLHDGDLLARATLAFVAFTLCAAGQYAFNDLRDLAADRTHPTKSRRPIATGALSPRAGRWLIAATWLSAAALAAMLGFAFGAVLLAYLLLMLAYSWRLKHVPILDAVMLGAGYTLRVAAGAAAVAIFPSPWLIAFNVCFFYSLALIKRYGELMHLRERDGPFAHDRGYLGVDLPIVGMFGIASGYLAVLVLVMYLTTGDPARHLQQRPLFIGLTAALLAYWISYLWLVANRGRMDDDPVVFALRDRQSRAIVMLMGVCAWLAL